MNLNGEERVSNSMHVLGFFVGHSGYNASNATITGVRNTWIHMGFPAGSPAINPQKEETMSASLRSATTRPPIWGWGVFPGHVCVCVCVGMAYLPAAAGSER